MRVAHSMRVAFISLKILILAIIVEVAWMQACVARSAPVRTPMCWLARRDLNFSIAGRRISSAAREKRSKCFMMSGKCRSKRGTKVSEEHGLHSHLKVSPELEWKTLRDEGSEDCVGMVELRLLGVVITVHLSTNEAVNADGCCVSDLV